MENKKAFSEIIFENIKELVRAKNAAHESMFKFHWKKLPPFNLIWPQVDYVRIMRFMGEIAEQCSNQKAFIQKNKNQILKEEKDFIESVPAYLEALANSCAKLAKAAEFKQGILEKTQKRDVLKFNKILKDYEEAEANLVRCGAFVRLHWGKLKTEARN